MNKPRIKAVIFASLAIISYAMLTIFITGLFAIPFEMEGLIITLSTAVISVILTFIAVVYSKEYKLRYLFLGKNFNKQVSESLKKFNISDPNFIKTFIKTRKKTYRQTGKIYNFKHQTNLSRDNNLAKQSLELYRLLLESIKSKGGFVEFCNKLTLKEFESNWFVCNLITTNLISDDLCFILLETFILTDFYVSDNGLSEEYTKRNNQNIEVLNKLFSPALMNFEEEINQVIKKLENALNEQQ